VAVLQAGRDLMGWLAGVSIRSAGFSCEIKAQIIRVGHNHHRPGSAT
jgi:hypothetical protein